MKNYYVEGTGWFVVTAPNKKAALAIGAAEYARENVRVVRRATPQEVADYINQKGEAAMSWEHAEVNY